MDDIKAKPSKENSSEEIIKVPPIKKRVKPDIEGITVPAQAKSGFGPKLTSAEKSLIEETGESGRGFIAKPEEQKIVLPKHKSGYAKWIWLIILLALLAGGGYKGYTWYLNRPAPAAENNNSDTPLIQPTDSLTPTSSPDALAAENAAEASSTPPVSATTTPPAPITPTLKINANSVGFLNVRQSPSTGSGIITKAHPGEIYPYGAVQNDWYRITLPSGKTGWVAGQYITKM